MRCSTWSRASPRWRTPSRRSRATSSRPCRAVRRPPAGRAAARPHARPPRGRRAALLAQGDRHRPGERRARPRSPPGRRAPPRRRDRRPAGRPQRVRDHRDPDGRRLGRRDEAARAAGLAPRRDPRRRGPGALACACDADRHRRPRAPDLEPDARARRGARARIARRRVRDDRGSARRRPRSSARAPPPASRSSAARGSLPART